MNMLKMLYYRLKNKKNRKKSFSFSPEHAIVKPTEDLIEKRRRFYSRAKEGQAMATVFDVADFFVELANSNEDDNITNLKLNKLLFFAQGVYLSRTGRALFDNRIEAWQYGPVVREVYDKYKVCGRSPITCVDEDYSSDVFTTEELETLLDVAREYGKYTGNALVTLTHLPDTPWSITTEAGRTVISEDLIKQYFLKPENQVKRFADTINTPVIESCPKEWYDPAEDAEWEAYLSDE